MSSNIERPVQRPSSADVPWVENSFAKWLLTDGWGISDAIELVDQLASRLTDNGIALRRMRIVMRTLHPLVFGKIFSWSRDAGATEEYSPAHEVLDTLAYRDSPIAAVIDGVKTIRRRLDVAKPQLDFPYLAELIAEGATDYAAMPIISSDGKVNVMTLVSDTPGGFRDDDLEQISGMLPALARVLEVHTWRHFSQTLLATYLGKSTGTRVLDGLIKRGDGERVHAVIWFSDLRDSTLMAERMAPSDFLGVLNSFFDCTAGAVRDHGGEVLNFIGDAVLAIFPISCESGPLKKACASTQDACAKALDAALDARARIWRTNEQREARGEPALGFGLALHVGNLMYGNIGVPERLQFTVVGAAVNHAARLQGLCKNLDQAVLASSAIARCDPDRWVSLGRHELRGIAGRQEVFALSVDLPSTC